MTCLLGGEDCFNTELTGPGTIWLQSLSYEKLIQSLVRAKPSGPPQSQAAAVGEGAGAGALAGGLSRAAFGGPDTEEMVR